MRALNRLDDVSEIVTFKQGEPGHAKANDLIHSQYAKHFDCDLKTFMPASFNLHKCGELVACTGYRPASDESLFLEQYLDSPIEHCLEMATGNPSYRRNIVEIGGFAVTNPSFALAFMVQLAPLFAELGFITAVCVVTDPVRKYLKKLGIQTVFLGDANPEKVDTSNNAWGTYYDLKPCILAGDINAAVEHILPFKKFLNQ